jgi:phosphatidylinositol dimannoside acyltransferase
MERGPAAGTGVIEGSVPPGGAESPSERASYLAFAAVERVAMALPEFAGRRLFDLGGVAAFHAAPKARRVVEGNLSRVLGERASPRTVRAAAKEAFRSYARYWYDTFHVRTMPDDEFMARQRYVGQEHIARALDAGGGVVLALPHLGNWDTAGKWVHLTGWRITAVAEALRPRRLYELFFRHRRALGMRIVGLEDDRRAGEWLVRLMGENELIALVADRDLTGRGVTVEMFGQERRMPPGPALLSLVTGSPLLPAACYDVEDGWITYIEPPLEIGRTGSMRDDVTTLTRLLAKRFERAIAAAPTQWHMFQPAWPEERPAAEAPVAAADPAAP